MGHISVGTATDAAVWFPPGRIGSIINLRFREGSSKVLAVFRHAEGGPVYFIALLPYSLVIYQEDLDENMKS